VSKNHDIIEIAGEVHNETEKAFLFFDGDKKAWVPKSKCDWDADSKTMQMPEWLAIDKGFV